ncbi:MAG: hypothetical protein KF727_15200 [Microbacteriaceae bacterium]|nr:hypothetical protein [Microbacteriaceae bacterium]
MELDGTPLAAISTLWLRAGQLLTEQDAVVERGSSAQHDHEHAAVRPETPPWIVTGKLMSAYDGARAAAVLWREREVHVIADYSLLRVIVENAALAWWVLQGTGSEGRMHRAFRVVTDDLAWAIKRETFAVAHARTAEGRKKRSGALAGATRELERVTTAFRTSLPGRQDSFYTPRRIEMAKVLVEAESSIPETGDLDYSLLWWIASTSAHGSLSAVRQLAQPGEAGEASLYPDAESVAAFAARAAHLLHTAHASWNVYRRASS